MKLVLKLKPETTLAQAENFVDEITSIDEYMEIIEDVEIVPEGVL